MDLYENKILRSKRSFVCYPCFAYIRGRTCVRSRWELVDWLSFVFFPLSSLICSTSSFFSLGKWWTYADIRYRSYVLFTSCCWDDLAFCLADLWPYRRSEEHTSELQSRLH